MRGNEEREDCALMHVERALACLPKYIFISFQKNIYGYYQKRDPVQYTRDANKYKNRERSD